MLPFQVVEKKVLGHFLEELQPSTSRLERALECAIDQNRLMVRFKCESGIVMAKDHSVILHDRVQILYGLGFIRHLLKWTANACRTLVFHGLSLSHIV